MRARTGFQLFNNSSRSSTLRFPFLKDLCVGVAVRTRVRVRVELGLGSELGLGLRLRLWLVRMRP